MIDMPYAYVVYDHGRAENVAVIREWAHSHDIILAGRYSEWEYYNSDHAFIAGRNAALAVKEARQTAAAAEQEKGASCPPTLAMRVPVTFMSGVAIWGGVECSVNRIGDRWHDQLELSGHDRRLEDLDLIASLGIRTLRYPVLWERTAPNSPNEQDWSWADTRMSALRSLAIDPIVGLVHHGSGPRYTSLLDENFAPGLARFALDCARRFPWVTRYTPVNEPLTTARFSALYGHWYPHHRNERSFARALLNQCRAVALSMSAIRSINPAAELVQTEDLGTTYSTPHMGYQRDFDNERRWLSWDLLCGRVDKHHALRPFLERAGITAEELDWFVAHPCPPQIIGINHYVTSDRYLDERVSLYPPNSRGSTPWSATPMSRRCASCQPRIADGVSSNLPGFATTCRSR